MSRDHFVINAERKGGSESVKLLGSMIGKDFDLNFRK